MNIEQLAIEHGSTCYTGQEYHFDKRQLEAFAKAYAQQQSEPVCNVEGTWLWLKLMDYCRAKRIAPATANDLFAIAGEAHKLYKHPNTVPVEQYNKLLGKIAELEATLLACSNENIALRDAIAEAEEKL